MVFGLFKKKDPICGMTQEKGRGFIDKESGNWFCAQNCKAKFDKAVKEAPPKKSCCH